MQRLLDRLVVLNTTECHQKTGLVTLMFVFNIVRVFLRHPVVLQTVHSNFNSHKGNAIALISKLQTFDYNKITLFKPMES